MRRLLDSWQGRPYNRQSMAQSLKDVEDFSIGTWEVLARHRLTTVEELARWHPPVELHPLVFDNIQMVLDDLGLDWPPLPTPG